MALNRLKDDIITGALDDLKLEREYVFNILLLYEGSKDKPFLYHNVHPEVMTILIRAGLFQEVYDGKIQEEKGLTEEYFKQNRLQNPIVLQFTEKGLKRAEELLKEYELINGQPLIRRKKSS